MNYQDITNIDDVKQLQTLVDNQRSELMKLKSLGTGASRGVSKEEAGNFKKIKKTIARLLTRINELKKGQCPKGGLHYPFQDRSNKLMCRKCGVNLK